MKILFHCPFNFDLKSKFLNQLGGIETLNLWLAKSLANKGYKIFLSTNCKKIIKRKNLTNIPVCSGFGIKTPEDAKKVANSGCNGVIVGSTFVKYIQDNINAPDLTQSFGKQVKSFSKVLK